MKNLIFRAWDLEEKKMYDVESIHPYDEPDENGMEGEVFYKGGKTSNFYGTMSEDTDADLEQCKIIQWTGFYDKKRNKVFVGDIVEAYSAGSKGTFEVRFRMDASPCFILYPAWNKDNNTFWKIHVSEYGPGKTYTSVGGIIDNPKKTKYFMDDGIEVIGNIYENPELLGN